MLRYCGYTAAIHGPRLELEYSFALDPLAPFKTRLSIPNSRQSLDATGRRLAFLIGMVELISYWKLACPARISVECGTLDNDEITWWKELIRHGLGEFFFLNEIPPQIEFNIETSGSVLELLVPETTDLRRDARLILVGGGKDSIVTLELMKELEHGENTALCVNPIPASIDAINAAQYGEAFVISRTLDPRLRDLNSSGYLNGHTPYSALLAFVSTLTAYQNGYSEIVASNESSASEGNIHYHGVEVNHQYSKSFAFESAFRGYLEKLSLPIAYFSFLRPLNELQICALFSQRPAHHAIFRSCNREQTLAARSRSAEPTGAKRPGWCGACPKCVFTYICLSCFLELDQVDRIFGESPRFGQNFTALVRDLSGSGAHKPFECVGTHAEVQVALSELCEKLRRKGEHECAASLSAYLPASPQQLVEVLSAWNKDHFLDDAMCNLLRRKIQAIAGEGR